MSNPPNAMMVTCGRCNRLMPFRETHESMAAVFACRTCDNIVQIAVGHA